MIFCIIGYGRFGKLWANYLQAFGKVWIYDPSISFSRSKFKKISLQQLNIADVIFITVPISQLEKCCKKIKKYLNPKTLIVDCCSVKTYPIKIIRKILGKDQPFLPTHPLFGPDSVQKNKGLQGLKIVICPQKNMPSEKQKKIFEIFSEMELMILKTTPTQHDRQMANSQALVHFIGRGLSSLNLQQQLLSTPDFQALLHIHDVVNNDRWQLFLDMQHFNPYTKKIRQKFLQKLLSIEKQI